MARKYQLNFLEEEDQRKAFSKQQKSVQYKMNYLTCSILFILQVILFIRLQVFDRSGFHIVVVSALVSVLALALNHQYTRFATILVFVQYILLNAQFTTDIYQRFIFQLVSNKPEMFLIGLGYGSLNLLVISTFQKWYVRCACMCISCVLAFVWSDTSFSSKLSYLVIVYITTIFGIIFFYISERFERENFSIIFQQNRSLSDWQRIIKENIPQSMVFVTRPKTKSTSSASSQIKKEVNDNQLSTKIELSNQMREKSDSKNVAQNNELVFNFVNKKFYDQFKIKDWVEKQQQQQQPMSNQAHSSQQQQQQQQQGLSKFAFAGGLTKNQNDAISSNSACAESQLHQILFNSIFKNILVSPSEGGRSFNDFDSSVENTEKTVDTQTLSEFLKSFIDEQRNQCDQNYFSEDYQGSQNQPSHSQSPNRRDSVVSPDTVKGLNCFYRPSPPSYVLGEQQILEEECQRQEQLLSKEKEKGKKSLFPFFSQSSKAGALSAAETNDSKAHKKQFTNNNFLTITETDNLVGTNSKLESGRESQHKEEILFTQDFVSPRIIDHLSKKTVSKGLIELNQDQHTIIDQDKLDPSKKKQQIQITSQLNAKDSETKEAVKLFANQEKEKSMGTKEFTPRKEIQFVKTNHIQIQIPPPNKNPQDTLIEIEDDEDDEDSRDAKGKVQQKQLNQEGQDKMTSNRGVGSAIQTNFNSPQKNTLDKANNGKDNLLIPQSNFLGSVQQGDYEKNSIGTPREMQKENQEGRGAAAILSNSQNIIQFERRTDQTQQKGDQFNRNEADKEDESNQAFFFDTQMVSCMWGDEEGVLLILNDVSLKIINEKLREIERFKDKMLSTVTHDLKTPLNSIIMIMENSFEQKGGLGKKQRKIILQNSQMLMSLINDILDYSQIRRDKFRLIIEQIFISKCVLDVVDLFEMQANQKRVKISAKFVNLRQEYMMNDERRIKQILVNLIGNALKFTQQEGSIEVIVKQKQPDCIQIAIRDTGTGISEEIQKKLFQFFNTFDHSEKANNRHGIGLGLAICKQLNSQLGPWHEIKLKSQVDKGSKFTFCLYVNLLNHEGIDSPIQPALVPQKAVLERQMSVRLGPLDSCKLEMLSQSTRRFQLHRSATENPEAKARQAHITNLIKWTTNQTISECMTGNSLQNIGQNGNILPAMKDATKNQLSRKSSFNCEGDQASTKVSKQTGQQQAQLRIPESKFSENHRLGTPLASPKMSQPQKEFGPQYLKLKIQKRDSLKPTQFGLNSIPSIQSSGFLKLQESSQFLAAKSRGNNKDIPLNSKGRSTNSRAVTVKLQIPEGSRKSGILKAFTSEHTRPIINYANSLIIPQFSPSAPISFKTRQQTQDSKNQSESMSPQFAHKLSEGTTSKIFGLKSKLIGQQSSAGSRRGSGHSSRGKYSYKTQRSSHGLSNKLNLQNSQHFIESVALGSDIFPSPKSKKQGKLPQTNDQNLLETVEERVKATTDENNSEERASENFAQIEEFKNKFKIMPEHILPSSDGGEELSSLRNSVQIPNESVLIQTYDTEQLQANPSTINHQIFSKNTVQSSQQMTNNNIIIHSSSSIVEEVAENNQIIATPQKKINMKSANEDGDERKPIENENEDEEEDNDDDYEDVIEEEENNGEELNGTMKNQKQILTACGKYQNITTNRKHKHNQHLEENQEQDEEEDGRDSNDEEDDEDDDDEEDDDEDKNQKVICSTDMHNVKNRGINERKQQSEMLISLLQDYRCVLIADDSPFNIFCLEQVLGKNTQLKINVAYNGNEALNSYKKNREQIIFMDLNMPILDGYECMKCIRQFEEDMEIIERTKIIIISAQEYEPFFCNFDGFLSKPLKLLDIINLLALFKANDHNNKNNNVSVDNITLHPVSLSHI